MRWAVGVLLLAVGAGAVIAGRLPQRASPRPAIDADILPRAPRATRFGFPVGGGTARGYYDAQPFGENHHLGSDWNGTGGGDSDLGDPVLAVADGVVLSARDHERGWGNVIRVAHDVGPVGSPRHVESLYAHLDTMSVKRGTVVRRGQVIGTIGTAHGRYRAHLHFEIRDRVGMPLGRGYSERPPRYILDPTAFIRARR